MAIATHSNALDLEHLEEELSPAMRTQSIVALVIRLVVTTKLKPGGMPRELTFTSVYDLDESDS